MELEAPVAYLKVQESSLKRRHTEDNIKLVNKKKDERYNKQAEVILNKSVEKLLENLEEEKEKAIDKITLLMTEYGTYDSETEESKKLMLLRYNSKIKKDLDIKKEDEAKKEIREDIHASRWASKDINNSIWAQKDRSKNQAQYEIVRQNQEQKVQTKDTRSLTLTLTIWDLPKDAKYGRVTRCLSFYGKTRILEWRMLKKTKAALVQITGWSQKRIDLLASSWSVHFEKGSMCRITPGRFDSEVLEKRRKYKAALRDIPKSALESMLLRQLRPLRVKAVFIPNNSNGNKRCIAFAYFESEENCKRAKKMSVFYYHNKLS
jgi:hypothetical protein